MAVLYIMTDVATITRENDTRVDELEKYVVDNLPPVECPLRHRFTPGMYVREIFMPEGSLITSLIHLTCHPYVVSMGAVQVSIDGKDWHLIEAPFTGITKPGTRRILFNLKDTIWSTFHPLPYITGDEDKWDEVDKLKLVEKIEGEILEQRVNPLLGGMIKQNKIVKECLPA